jgi:hypothetical protein
MPHRIANLARIASSEALKQWSAVTVFHKERRIAVTFSFPVTRNGAPTDETICCAPTAKRAGNPFGVAHSNDALSNEICNARLSCELPARKLGRCVWAFVCVALMMIAPARRSSFRASLSVATDTGPVAFIGNTSRDCRCRALRTSPLGAPFCLSTFPFLDFIEEEITPSVDD